MTIGSLFSGIGGLELGLEMCGAGPVVWQAESDPYARAVLEKHWPTVKRYDDVRSIDGTAERPDIICGGFPCQDISNAGTRSGLSGDRSGLWREFSRIVRLVRPRYVFVENVAALLARGMAEVIGDLAEAGYDTESGCFRASEVGAPHLRWRVFILAYANNTGREQQRGTGAVRAEFAAPECGSHRFPPGPDLIAEWDGAQPVIRGSDDGISRRVDRLRCLGNAVVPQQAALAFRTLLERATT